MRKTLSAMVGLLALGVWALPALAGDYDLPKVSEPAPMTNRTGRIGALARGDEASYNKASLSGTLLKQAQVTSTWFLYPNACKDRDNGLPGTIGTWVPKSTIVADSLDTYNPATQDHHYQALDFSLKEHLWHITDGSDSPDIGAGLVLSGARSLWCGKYDVNWLVKSGYPNLTYQILYIDTDLTALNGGVARSAPYTLSWQENSSTEFNYDYLWLVGGGDGATQRDPIGNSRARIDKCVSDGFDGDAEMLLIQTGSQVANQTLSYVVHGQQITGLGAGQPSLTSWSLSGIPAKHRGIYIVFYADCLYSNEDGLWAEGHGARLDNITASDQPGGVGNLFAEQTTTSGGLIDPFEGDVLWVVNGEYQIVSRVAPGVGTVWTVQAGNSLPSGDYCSPQKQRLVDKMFLGADATSKLTLANEYASVVTCTFPIPTGTASVLAVWGEYLDLPGQSGMVQNANFRIYRDGVWGNWTDTSSGVRTGALQAWTTDGDEIAQATQADSVQMRYDIQCINFFAVDHVNCQPVQYGIIYDDLYLRVLTGVPAPVFDVFPGQIAASTFVDGTDAASVNCSAGQIAAGQCWPGIRGSNIPDIDGVSGPVHNNFNNPYGDTLTLNLLTGVRKNGMGVNWKYGFDKAALAGEHVTRLNPNDPPHGGTGGFNPSFDTPRWIFRIFDPATKTWSPWDSSALFANSASISGNDTILIDSEFRFDWPPYDKYYVNSGMTGDIGVNVDANLPGAPGWTLNGHTKFSQVPFLPRGTRVQYYFKAVDILGGVSLNFGTDRFANETEDLPTLPGSSIKAPDIIEFDVLPRAYPVGSAGSLADGRTDTKVLNLDSRYSSWPDGYDPVTQALRAMGVRADRYRHTQGARNASGIGGHEFPGRRVERLSDYFPNANEYGIVGLLASHYNIFIDNPHTTNDNVYDEEDAYTIQQWWLTDTGLNGGDRCTFVAGDNVFNWLLLGSKSFPQSAQQISLATNVYGVASVIDAWTGTNTTPYPTIDDRFAGGGPGLAAPGTYTYPLDGGCPNPQRFDGLTKIGSADALNSAFYPGGVTEVAGIARSSELDAGPNADNDRNKALSYGFSINYIRTAGIPTTAANYVHSGVENRMKVLYKFLTSCRKTSVSTTPCWPCPSNPAEITTNWGALVNGFQTGTYGGLFEIQDYTQATGVGVTEAPKVNRLEGNFPNPFNPETAIRFSAATQGKVTIRIFNVAGRLVNTLTKNVTETGLNEIRWNGKSTDGRAMASGMYFYRIRFANGQESEAKMTMLK